MFNIFRNSRKSVTRLLSVLLSVAVMVTAAGCSGSNSYPSPLYTTNANPANPSPLYTTSANPGTGNSAGSAASSAAGSAYLAVNNEPLTNCQAVFSDNQGYDVMALTGYYGDLVCVAYVTYNQNDSRSGYTMTKNNADEYHVYSFAFSDSSGDNAQTFDSIYSSQYFNDFRFELKDYGRQSHAKFSISFELVMEVETITFYGEGDVPWVYVEPTTTTTPDTNYVDPQAGTRRCMACSGSSGVCRVCDGKGKTVGDVHGNLRTCQSCGGSGLCIACNGTGRY